jgi:hypothetical protein
VEHADKKRPLAQLGDHVKQPKVLVAATVRWPTGARLALALERAGFIVDAVYPAEHPLGCTRAVSQSYNYSAVDPLGSLTRAMQASAPDLVVPCDDRVVCHIHSIYERSLKTGGDTSGLGALIERSLGDPSSHATTISRAGLLEVARQEQVPVPPGWAVTCAEDLNERSKSVRFPWVLKVDGTWGGGGVKVVHSVKEAEVALRRITLSQAAKRLNHLIIHRDRFLLRDLLRNQVPGVILQEFIHGWPATSLVACWKGEVLAQVNAEVLCAQGNAGASTIVKVVDRPEMDLAAERLVRRLGLSGLCGLDFMIEAASGSCYLIEMNPRNTQLGHLNLGDRRDLAAALYARVTNSPVRQHPLTTTSDIIAFFPQAEHFHSTSSHLRTAHLDVPYEDPALLRELARTPYNGRGFMARAVNTLIRRVRDPTLPPRKSRKIVREQRIT